jgi:hypothetical protein
MSMIEDVIALPSEVEPRPMTESLPVRRRVHPAIPGAVHVSASERGLVRPRADMREVRREVAAGEQRRADWLKNDRAVVAATGLETGTVTRAGVVAATAALERVAGQQLAQFHRLNGYARRRAARCPADDVTVLARARAGARTRAGSPPAHRPPHHGSSFMSLAPTAAPSFSPS